MAFSPEEMQIIEWSKKNGKTPQEMQDAIFRFRTTGSPVDPNNPPQQQVQQETSTAQDVGIGAAKLLGENAKLGLDAAATGAGLAVGTIPGGDFLKSTINAGVGGIKDKALEAVGLTDDNLAASNPTQANTKLAITAGTFLSPVVASSFAKLAARTPAKLAQVAETGGAKNVLERGAEAVKSFVKDPKLALAKQNVDPRLETSAQRLFIKGTERLDDPVAAYDGYVTQAKKALEDIKVDPPLATVGESVGDAFRSVVQQRRAVGKTLETELKKTANNPIPLKGTLNTLQQELLENGVAYDAVDKRIIASASSKFSEADRSFLELYASELQKLGSNPTMRDLDAFVSRMPNEIEGLKASKNLKTVTNAERIIGTHLSSLRSALTEAGTPEYAAARTQYSELSNFITEGSQYLGKVTQDGDFARDASLIKSSVQSLLNNGKKDWLVKLEDLTGYPAMDDGVLALQAMKDAGDFRGQSLLQLLSEGSTPTSVSSITQKAIDFALQKAGRAVSGTPEQQTRALLQSLKQNADTAITPASPSSAAPAATLAGQADNAVNALAALPSVQDENGEVDPRLLAAAAVIGWIGAKKGPLTSSDRMAYEEQYDTLMEWMRLSEKAGRKQAMRRYKDMADQIRLKLRNK